MEYIYSTIEILVLIFIFILPLCVLWDIISFIIFLAIPKDNEAKHKRAEDMFIISSEVLTVVTVLTAVSCLLIMLIDNFI